jgi:hypothetical protein
MSKQITKSEAFTLLLGACPDAHEAWEEHKLDYEGEHEDLPYLGMAIFARHIVELMDAGKTESFPVVFQLIERLTVEGDEELRGLAIVGLLEGIQNNASWRDSGYGVFTKWLQPNSLAAWHELEKVWEGKNSLADVIREEGSGG